MNAGLLGGFGAPAPSLGKLLRVAAPITSSTGTYRPLPNTKWLRVTLLGGGGGGGAYSGSNPGVGGNAGACASTVIAAVPAGHAYAVGAGGAAGAAGQDTTFAGALTAPGGAAGPVGATNGGYAGVVGQGSPFGSGGAPSAAATGYGAGGGGAPSAGSAGAGTGGLILVEEYAG